MNFEWFENLVTNFVFNYRQVEPASANEHSAESTCSLNALRAEGLEKTTSFESG